MVLLGLGALFMDPWHTTSIAGPALLPPSGAHLMGTDALGRDLLRGMILGAQTSLLVSAAVGVISFAIGAAVGTLAGYHGGRVDDLLMRGTEFFQVIPRFFLAIMAIALFGPGVEYVILVLGVSSWPLLARVIRAEVLVLMELDFVRAARAAGASAPRIVFRELLPNALPAALVMLGLLMGQVILIESSLSFIGLGDPARVSWGGLAGVANPFLRVAWWMPLFPGLAIAATVLGCNLLADAATDALGEER